MLGQNYVLKRAISGNREDSCNPTSLTKIVSLPEGCTEDSSEGNSVNVGTCSIEACVKRNQRHAVVQLLCSIAALLAKAV